MASEQQAAWLQEQLAAVQPQQQQQQQQAALAGGAGGGSGRGAAQPEAVALLQQQMQELSDQLTTALEQSEEAHAMAAGAIKVGGPRTAERLQWHLDGGNDYSRPTKRNSFRTTLQPGHVGLLQRRCATRGSKAFMFLSSPSPQGPIACAQTQGHSSTPTPAPDRYIASVR